MIAYHYQSNPLLTPKKSPLVSGFKTKYDRRFNDIPDLTTKLLCPGKIYSKLYGAESRFNNIRFNDIPSITMEISRGGGGGGTRI